MLKTAMRRAMRSGALACVLLLPLGGGLLEAEAQASRTKAENQAMEVAQLFLSQATRNPVEKINTLLLRYDIYLESDLFVKMKMAATLTLRKEDGFEARLQLREPEGEGVFSRLVISLIGRHTRDYREMLRTIETELVERFFIAGDRFRTRELIEVLQKDKYPGQTAIRVFFDTDQGWVKGWKDHTADSHQLLPYNGQVGPFTAFYNYAFFDPALARIRMINALKEVSTEGDAAEEPQVGFLFETQAAQMGPNRTGRHPDWEYAVCLERSNFLDIVYGSCIFYRLVVDTSGRLKLPYAVKLDGIISKEKKRRRARQLAELESRRSTMTREAYDQQRLGIEADSILAARNVRVFLRQAQITTRY